MDLGPEHARARACVCVCVFVCVCVCKRKTERKKRHTHRGGGTFIEHGLSSLLWRCDYSPGALPFPASFSDSMGHDVGVLTIHPNVSVTYRVSVRMQDVDRIIRKRTASSTHLQRVTSWKTSSWTKYPK
jgi:hypothetical protein